MKKETKNVVRVILSILYIIWGIAAPLSLIKAIIAFDLAAILGLVGGVLMLLAGVLGLLKVKVSLCRSFGVIIFLINGVSFVLTLLGGGFNLTTLVSALLAWLFIVCL